jgi:membrane dipeptidase
MGPNGTNFSDSNYATAIHETYQQIDLMQRLIEYWPHEFGNTPTAEKASLAFAKGQLISPLGVEGLHQIGNSLSILRTYYSLGVRYATLTHNCHNIYADAALSELGNAANGGIEVATPLWGGLSPDGRELVAEMNRMGMIVDLAHVSWNVMVDVLGGRKGYEGSKAPVIFSHSSR